MEGLLLLAARLSARAVSLVLAVGCGVGGGGWVWASRALGGGGGEGEGCAVVAAVEVITFATNARVGLASGPLAHVRRGESGLGGIDAYASPGIVSASWNVSLASESSSESVSKAVSLGRKDSRTGTLSFLGVSGGGFSGEGTAPTPAALPDEADARQVPRLLAEVHSPLVVVVVGLFDRTVGKLDSRVLPPWVSATRSAAASRGWV